MQPGQVGIWNRAHRVQFALGGERLRDQVLVGGDHVAGEPCIDPGAAAHRGAVEHQLGFGGASRCRLERCELGGDVAQAVFEAHALEDAVFVQRRDQVFQGGFLGDEICALGGLGHGATGIGNVVVASVRTMIASASLVGARGT